MAVVSRYGCISFKLMCIFVLTLRKAFLMKNMSLLKMLLLTVAHKNMEIILHHKVKINFILACFTYLNL